MNKPKPHFFYEGGGRNKVLNQIQHCLRFSPGVIALTAPTGSGRSLLIHTLVDLFKEDATEVCLLTEESAVLETVEELYRALAEGFGLEEKPIEMLEDLLDRVQHFIQLGIRNKRAILIAVDDVKQHSDEVLEELLQLATRIKGLNILLSGEPSLFDTLKKFHIRSVVIHQITLRPLLAEEALDFFRQYLLQYGISDQSLLNRKTQDELMSSTGGNLSLLVREAQHMVSDASTKVDRSYKDLPAVHIAAFIVVITVTLLAYYYYPDSSKSVREDNSFKNVVDTDATVANSMVIPSGDTDGIVSSKDQSPSVAMPQRLAGEFEESAVSHSPQHEAAQEKSAYTNQEQELLTRPTGNVTLQLMSLSSEKNAKAFADSSLVPDKRLLSYYRRGTVTQTSYVVLYGDYSDKQKAIEAQKTLPDPLKKLAPWPRAIADIQRELRQRD